ncbi:Carbonyl reductase [NADPH] 3 [Gonapodya sp. JEL0774]|nr:Carbonyl reductase [NADPH] 3 [Gonapodya sp. JEL0774]
MDPRIAVVTGANKGIGLSIVRRLCREYSASSWNQPPRPLIVYLTSRDQERGEAAASLIRTEMETLGESANAVEIRYHVLDVTEHSHIDQLAKDLVASHGERCIDALVLNAGVSYPDADLRPHIVAEVMGTNYWGVRDVASGLWDHLRERARVVIVGSMIGRLSMVSPSLREKFLADDTKAEDIDALMYRFVEVLAEHQGDSTKPEPEAEGYYRHVYCTAKMGVHCFARVLAREEAKRDDKRGVVVVSCCPGAVYTDQTAKYGPQRPSQLLPDAGADTPVWLVLHTSTNLLDTHTQEPHVLPPRESSAIVPGCFYKRRARSVEVFSGKAMTYGEIIAKAMKGEITSLNTFVEDLEE